MRRITPGTWMSVREASVLFGVSWRKAVKVAEAGGCRILRLPGCSAKIHKADAEALAARSVHRREPVAV
jgi:hypothetical protein